MARRGWIGRLVGLGVLGAAACSDRARLVFPGPDTATGPVVITITKPAQDTTLHQADSLVIVGNVTTPDGIDSIWFTVQGPLPPIGVIHGGGLDTVTFGQVFPPGSIGDTGTIRIFVAAVNLLGDTGQTKSRTYRVVP
ncbi:MAG TPA: hypothetical protein VFS28_01565 [Gemmatimonadales bacterium]|nr:hypothetical protein [Gemmatimonadales bacterium]